MASLTPRIRASMLMVAGDEEQSGRLSSDNDDFVSCGCFEMLSDCDAFRFLLVDGRLFVYSNCNNTILAIHTITLSLFM